MADFPSGVMRSQAIGGNGTVTLGPAVATPDLGIFALGGRFVTTALCVSLNVPYF